MKNIPPMSARRMEIAIPHFEHMPIERQRQDNARRSKANPLPMYSQSRRAQSQDLREVLKQIASTQEEAVKVVAIKVPIPSKIQDQIDALTKFVYSLVKNPSNIGHTHKSESPFTAQIQATRLQ